MTDLCQGLVLLEGNTLLLLVLVQLLVVLFDCEQLGFYLNHLFLIEVKKLHITHLLFIRYSFMCLVQLV